MLEIEEKRVEKKRDEEVGSSLWLVLEGIEAQERGDIQACIKWLCD